MSLSYTHSVRINVVGAMGPELTSATHTPDAPHNFLSFPRFLSIFSRTIYTTRLLFTSVILIRAIPNSVPFPPTLGPQPRRESRPFPTKLHLHPARST